MHVHEKKWTDKKKRDRCMHVHEKKMDGPKEKKKGTDPCMSIKKKKEEKWMDEACP